MGRGWGGHKEVCSEAAVQSEPAERVQTQAEMSPLVSRSGPVRCRCAKKFDDRCPAKVGRSQSNSRE